jgi:hypothetical protein
MLSDAQVIRIVRVRLDHDLAGLLPPEDLLDRIRDQTRTQRSRAVAGRASPRRRDLAAVSLSVVVVLAIVAGALVTLSGSQQPHGASAPTGSGLPALVAKLSVLRSPQTAAATNYNRQVRQRAAGPLGGAETIRRLTRAVPVTGGATVYVFVSRTASSYGLGIAERNANGGGTGSCCSTAQSLSRPRGPAIESGYEPGHRQTLYYEVVPDGVARVRWEFPRHPIYVGGGPVPQFRHALTTTVTVHDNVAAIRIPERGTPARETWFAANGQLLASAALPTGAPKSTPGSVTSAIQAQDQRIQRFITDHGLADLNLTSAADARHLVSQLLVYPPAQARKLIPGLQGLRSQLSQAALVVESKQGSTPTQKEAQRDWVTGTQGLEDGVPVAGLGDIADHLDTATIALRRAQRTTIKCDRLRAKAERLLHIAHS